MGVISKVYEALQKILKRMDNKSITMEEVDMRCKVHALVAKQEQLAIKVLVLSNTSGITAKKLHSIGLVSKNEIIRIDSSELGAERIECPDLDKLISREECLDYSGEAEHISSCESCKNFNLTRSLLMPAG